jgi:hypothetical protein
MEKKQTALDILFQEIKESKSFLPDNLFDYLEMVYNKTKEMEKEQIKHAYFADFDPSFSIIDNKEAEEFYNTHYNKEDNG